MMTVARCLDCGTESAPWFGMWAPCSAASDGMHRAIVQVEVSRDEAARRLKEAYAAAPSFDRVHFRERAPRELQELLRS